MTGYAINSITVDDILKMPVKVSCMGEKFIIRRTNIPALRRYYQNFAKMRNHIVGLENNNDVWCTSDEQISEIVSGRLLSPVGNIPPSATVSTLIDHDLRGWRASEIDRNFLPFEATIIKAIPLCLFVSANSIHWPKTLDRIYSVKFGYKILLEEDGEDVSGVATADVMKGVWSRIWKLKVPNRVRNLLWRAGNDSLPTIVNLMKRKLLDDALCPHCKLSPKDSFHALWSCPELLAMWQAHFADLRVATLGCAAFLDVIQCAQHDLSCIDLFAMRVSMIWLRRNKMRVGKDSYPLTRVSSMAYDSLQEFQQLHPTQSRISRTARSRSWRLPPPGENIASLGIIIRNDQGLVMTVLLQQIPLLASEEIVEVLVTRRALLFAKELRFESLVMESDSEIIINTVKGDNMNLFHYGHLL
ncbi:uncharacterized protein LOC142625389 [Castanea sativa]|uniref:uncharacterized protein LOC142625389 n=1 Tax=Castanea sativa TaxID=21020 RepID=UPI003F64E58F